MSYREPCVGGWVGGWVRLTFHHSSVRPFKMCPRAIPKSVEAPVRWVVRTTELWGGGWVGGWVGDRKVEKNEAV